MTQKNQGNGVRWDKGNSEHEMPSQQVDHVRVDKGGKHLDASGKIIPRTPENPRPTRTEEAHILSETYKKWKNWGESE